MIIEKIVDHDLRWLSVVVVACVLKSSLYLVGQISIIFRYCK